MCCGRWWLCRYVIAVDEGVIVCVIVVLVVGAAVGVSMFDDLPVWLSARLLAGLHACVFECVRVCVLAGLDWMNSTELHELTGMAVLVSWITMVTCVYGVVSLFVLLMLMMLGVMLRCVIEWMALLSVVHCIHMIVCGVVRACNVAVGSRWR